MKPSSQLCETEPPPSYRVIQPLPRSLSLSPREQQSMTTLRTARLHSPWKRSACDHCRSRKLKCERDNENTTRSCIRCTRANAICFTSSAKSPARLSRARTNAELAPFVSSSTYANIDMAGIGLPKEHQSRTPEVQTSSESTRNQDLSFVMRWPFTHQGEHAIIPDINFDVDMPSKNDENGQTDYHNSSVDRSKLPFYSDHLSRADPSSVTPARLDMPLDLATGLPSGVDDVVTHIFSTQIETPASMIGDALDLGIRLADLQQSLSRQLAALESELWDLKTWSITSSTTATNLNQSGTYKEAGVDPVASILASTSEFITILRLFSKASSIPSPRSRPRSHQNQKGILPSMEWPGPVLPPLSPETYLSTPVSEFAPIIVSPTQKVQSRVHVLTTINCYFLVLSILDGIFSRLLAESENARLQEPTDTHPSLSLPPFSLLNPSSRTQRPKVIFVGHSANLNMQLCTRLLVRELEILEHDLGLPYSYRVSSALDANARNKPTGDGILGKNESLLLLQAVMGWTADDADDSEFFDREGESSRPPVASSLIDKLKRAQTSPTLKSSDAL
ncbi:hypothetical protein F4678DRAFT_348691 [Xylaria arbuscula]|nr:hypothetical protein F4678DRAFT_348691 [Xylaria arbuscula]